MKIQTLKTSYKILFILLLGILWTIPAQAKFQWTAHGMLVSTTDASASHRNASPDGNGGFFVAYTKGSDTDTDIYAQWINAAGDMQWTAGGVLVNGETLVQRNPAVLADGSGGVFIAWHDDGTSSIKIQRLNNSGTQLWGSTGKTICSASGEKNLVQMISDDANGAILIWQDKRNGNTDIYAQRVNSSGTAQWTSNGVVVIDEAHGQSALKVIADGLGGVYVTWQDARQGFTNYDIYAQRLDNTGIRQWDANGLAICTATGSQYSPQVDTSASNLLITWYDSRSGNNDIYIQSVDKDGNLAWTANGLSVCTATGSQLNPVIAGDGAGGAFIAWSDNRTGYDIYSQYVDNTGSAKWQSDGMAVYKAATVQYNPAVLSDGAGGVFVIWNDLRNGSDYDLFGQHLNADSTKLWDTSGEGLVTQSGNQLEQFLVSDQSGGILVIWEDERDSRKDLYTQHINDNLTITQPTSASNWDGNQSQNILWDFRTDNILYDHVDIYASVEDGDGYPISITEDVTPLNKSQSWIADTVNSSEVRIRIKAYNNGDLLVNTVTSDPFAIVSNQAPVISDITNQTTPEDTPKQVSFTISDEETASDDLTLSATSSNTDLILNENLIFGGSGGSRNITITPLENLSGTSTITITVSDGDKESSDTFDITVNAVNDAPTISDISNQSVDEDNSTSAVSFTIGDIDSDIGDLTVTASSSNTTLLPNSNIQLGGSDANRTITLTPADNENGTSTITVTVEDGDKSNSDTFVLTVNPVNDAPELFAIDDQSTVEDNDADVDITVYDMDTDLDDLDLTASSLNTVLIPNSNLSFSGSGTDYTLNIAPANDKFGTATITVELSDGDKTDTQTFDITVTSDNDAPVLAAISNQTTDEDTPIDIDLTVSDIDTDVSGLTLTGSAADKNLIPDANISFSGIGQNRVLSVNPASNLSGVTQVTVTLSDGDKTDIQTFNLTVTAENDAPTLTAVNNQVTDEDTPIQIDLTVTDMDSDIDGLTLSANTSNPALIPANNIVFGGSGGTRTATLTPADDQSGVATLTFTLSDGDKTDTKSFSLTVNPVNDAPKISDIATQTLVEDEPSDPIPFTISDSESDPNSLVLTYTISDENLIPRENVVFAGSGQDRTLAITPADNQYGNTTITITVSDGEKTGSDEFSVTVTAENDAPEISDISSQSTDEDVALNSIPFTVGDTETDAGNLTVFVASSNTTLIPESNIITNGSGSDRTISITPASNQNGIATITVTVSDGDKTQSDTFTLTVNAVNDPPTISGLSDQTMNEDADTFTLPFTVDDIESAEDNLIVTASSSNLTLIPGENLTLSGTGANRSVSLKPVSDMNGTTIIRLIVDDGQDATQDSFAVTITAVNDKPRITSVDSVQVYEDSLLVYIPSGEDTEGDTLSWTYINYPDWLLVTSDTLSGKPVEGRLDTTFLVIAEDGNDTDTLTVFVDVIPVNDPPVITSADTVIAIEKQRVIYKAQAEDVDGPRMMLEFQNIPSWMSQTGSILSGTPRDYTTDTTFTVIVSDSLLSDTLKVFVDVVSVNDPPVFDHALPKPVFTLSDSIEWEVCLDDYVSDPDDADSLLTWAFEILDPMDINIEILEPCHKLRITGGMIDGDCRIVLTVTDSMDSTVSDTLYLKLSTVGVEDLLPEIPKAFELNPNYPNPFNPQTTIQFGLPNDVKVTLIVYNILGQEVDRLIDNDKMKAGYHQVIWQGAQHPSGIYFYHIQTESWKSVRRMLLIK